MRENNLLKWNAINIRTQSDSRSRCIKLDCVGETRKSICQRRRKSSDKLDKIRLAAGAGFFKQPAEMSFHSRVGNAEFFCHLRHSADLNDGNKNAKLGRCEAVGPADHFR